MLSALWSLLAASSITLGPRGFSFGRRKDLGRCSQCSRAFPALLMPYLPWWLRWYHESEKWKWSHSVVTASVRSHGLQPTRLLRPWNFPSKSAGVGCIVNYCQWNNMNFTTECWAKEAQYKGIPTNRVSFNEIKKNDNNKKLIIHRVKRQE